MSGPNVQKIVDTTRRAVFVITGNSSAGPICVIAANTLLGAMNTNGQLANTGSGWQGSNYSWYPLAVRKVNFAVTSAAAEEYITLYWENLTTGNVNTILQLSGTGDLNLQDDNGFAALLTSPTANNGNIGMVTAGMNAANSSYSIIIEVRKMTNTVPCVWWQGQTADPASFNYSPYGMNTN